MGPLNLAVWALGIVLIVVGWSRARGPWERYQRLRDQQANVARYEAWRGGIRDQGPTGASVAMQMLRRQVQVGAIIAVVGILAVIAGFAIR